MTLLVTNSNSCQHDTVMAVNVNPKPLAMFQYDVSCIHAATQFTDLSIAPGSQLVTWLWRFGDPASVTSDTSTLKNPIHIYNTAGTYSVHLIVTNLAGCVDSVVTPIVAAQPAADTKSEGEQP